jgi:hypothetical protein
VDHDGVDVAVTTDGGTSATSASDRFIYVTTKPSRSAAGYWLVGSDGSFGSAPSEGSVPSLEIHIRDVVGIS